jgi:hypothetical protein
MCLGKPETTIPLGRPRGRLGVMLKRIFTSVVIIENT